LVHQTKKQQGPKAVKTTLSPETRRSFVPLTIQVSDTKTKPQITVKGNDVDIILDAKNISTDVWLTQFWLEKVGNYELHVSSANENDQLNFTVLDQSFLHFSREFGIFSALTFVALASIFAYVYIKEKFHVRS
jgi:hypothetical protein